MLGLPDPEDASFYVQKISVSCAGLREYSGHWKEIRKLRAGQEGAEKGGGRLTLLVLNEEGRLCIEEGCLCITQIYTPLRPPLIFLITQLYHLSTEVCIHSFSQHQDYGFYSPRILRVTNLLLLHL